MGTTVINEINDVRPTVIDHFVGQKRVVDRCKVALEAAWNQGTKIPHMLLQGGAGLGKTELSHILANEMGMDGELHEQLAQNIKTPIDLHAFLLTPSDREVCLIDEIHELPPIAQTTLYRAMENQQLFLESRRGRKSRPIKIANFTIIGATTDPQKLLQPLRDRFKVVLDFEHYREGELELLLKNRTRQLGWTVEEPIFSMIAKRGKGTPRIALRLLESTRMTASAEDSDVITVGHFQRTCGLEGIDAVGLSGNEIKYLKILYENSGSARLNVLASRLSLPVKHVSHIIENYLIRIGLVTKSNSLRVLTQAGLEHLTSYHFNEG
ncbi:MAG: Holliday junction DNA helicase RuvB C-terminal domain-containing protein [Candidatus Thorarchaeota archaeon]